MLSNIIKKRVKKYSALKLDLKNNKVKFNDFNNLFEIKLNKKEFENIKKLVIKYIAKNIKVFFNNNNKNFITISKLQKDILALPNITPNGVIKPKKEVIKEYKKLQIEIFKILKKKKILKNIFMCEFVEVRLMRSNLYKYNSSRPYSSSKIHSDSWSGNPCDAKVALYILGDKKNTIQFYSPKKIDTGFFKKKINYESAIKKYGYTKIKKFNTNYLTIFDQSCLHKTLNYNCGLRISIDFGMIVSKNINKSSFSNRYKNNFFKPKNKEAINNIFKKQKFKSMFDKSF